MQANKNDFVHQHRIAKRSFQVSNGFLGLEGGLIVDSLMFDNKIWQIHRGMKPGLYCRWWRKGRGVCYGPVKTGYVPSQASVRQVAAEDCE